MLSDPKTAGPHHGKRDSAADFIHELAEAGTASELGTVKAASDAVEGGTGDAARKGRRRKTRGK